MFKQTLQFAKGLHGPPWVGWSLPQEIVALFLPACIVSRGDTGTQDLCSVHMDAGLICDTRALPCSRARLFIRVGSEHFCRKVKQTMVWAFLLREDLTDTHPTMNNSSPDGTLVRQTHGRAGFTMDERSGCKMTALRKSGSHAI